MEPATVLAITNASMGIARSLVHTIKELYELAEAYETAALGIRTVATQCNSFRIAVERINKWLVKQNEHSRHDLDDDFWLALAGNIDTAKLVLEDLEKRIQCLKKSPTRFWTRTKYLWNGVVIAELQTQIQGLMSAVSILIQVIDIPITGAKRAQSRAQSKRLNGLTVSNRNRAREAHRRAQTEEADWLNDAAPSTSTEPQTQHDVLQAQQVGPDDPRGAPPAYECSATFTDFVSSDLKRLSLSAEEALVAVRTEPPAAEAISSFKVLDRSRSHEQGDPVVTKKWKQPKWKGFMKRSRKQESNRSNSAPVEATPDDAALAQDVPSAMQSSTISSTHLKETPAPIDVSSGPDSYFELENNTSVMSTEKGNAREMTSEIAGGMESSNGTHAPTSNSPPEGNLLNNGHNPYRDMRLTSQSESSRDSNRPNYRSGRVDSSDTFYHIRPAQRVLEAKERSQSRDPAGPSQTQTSPPATDALERQISGGGKLSNPRLGSDSENSRQTWQTTAMSNRCVKIKVHFETEAFTNRISLPAARALGVEDNIVEYAGVPTAILTLLYTVSDGLTAEANTVLGDEAEFAVISEHESRTPLLVLGQGFAHLAQLAEVGEFIYWNPGTVPEKLRSIDRLRLYRRFELVRW